MASRLILCLTICAFMESIANLFSLGVYGVEEFRTGECYFQGFLLQFSQIGIFSWITVIAVNLWLAVVHSRDTASLEIPYHIAVWLFAGLMTLIPLIDAAYGPAGVWCWIMRPQQYQGYRWGVFYVPLYIMILAVVVFYALISNAVRSRFDESNSSSAQAAGVQKLLVRLRIYPIVFVLCYIFPTINRIYDVAAESDSYFLYMTAAITASIQGFVNAIVYGFDVDMRRLWKNLLYRNGICMKWTQPATQAELDSSSDVSFN